MGAIKELEKKYFNDSLFEEELNNQNRKIDFIAELMEDYARKYYVAGYDCGYNQGYDDAISNKENRFQIKDLLT